MSNNLIPIIRNEDITIKPKYGICLDPDGSDEYYESLLSQLIGFYLQSNSNFLISIKDLKTGEIINYDTNFDESFKKYNYVLNDGLDFLIAEEGEYPVFILNREVNE